MLHSSSTVTQQKGNIRISQRTVVVLNSAVYEEGLESVCHIRVLYTGCFIKIAPLKLFGIFLLISLFA